MLVLPIQHRINWKNPPVLCLLLITANVLCYLIFSTGDDEKWDVMQTRYDESALLQYEWPLYAAYKPGLTQKKDHVSESSPEDVKAQVILLDKSFDQYVKKHWEGMSDAERLDTDVATWQKSRAEVEVLRDQQSALRFGVTPAVKKPYTFFTYMFMHGGVDHLLGNMIFLFLFGFSMEVVLGKLRFLVIYLLAGVCSAGFFCLFNQTSYQPLVGASGAIAGLMGMYVAAYGLKRIRFFYYLFFWFGEFTAPALMVLPLWVGKELWEQFHSDSNVAYLAHVGGIVSGYALAFVALKFSAVAEDAHYSLEKVDTPDDIFKRKMARVAQYVAKLDMGNAKSLCQALLQEYPERAEVWEKLYDIVKPHRDALEYHEIALNIFKQSNKEHMPTTILKKVFDDYKRPGQSPRALSGVICVVMARRFMEENLLQEADFLLRRAVELGYKHAQLPTVMASMLNCCKQNNVRVDLDFYQQQASL